MVRARLRRLNRSPANTSNAPHRTRSRDGLFKITRTNFRLCSLNRLVELIPGRER